MARKKQKARRFKRGDKGLEETNDVKLAPHSFVFYRGKVLSSVSNLMMDIRKIMSPYTASQLKVMKKNVLKDYIAVAGPLHVSHFIMLGQATSGHVNLKLVKVPQGPSLHFKVERFSLSSDFKSTYLSPQIFAHPPLVVVNNLSNPEQSHLKILGAMVSGAFPKLDPLAIHSKKLTRCVLFDYQEENDVLELRQYRVQKISSRSGISKSVKAIVEKNRLPDLSSFNDISDYISREAVSDSDGESITYGNKKIHMVEIGPRLRLKLFKIQEGLMEGEVLYHAFVSKTDEEKVALREQIHQKRQLKMQRRQEQEANVNRKRKRQSHDGEESDEADNADDANSEIPHVKKRRKVNSKSQLRDKFRKLKNNSDERRFKTKHKRPKRK